LDASVALAWFLPDEKPAVLEYSHSVLDFLNREVHQAVVPAIWHMEVAAVLLRRLRGRSLAEKVFDHALRTFAALPLETHKETPAVGEIVDIARRYQLQAGDAIYFELAYASDLPIATVDRGLRAAARAYGVKFFAA
jgi:predicted nucleic acid-binding protein